MDSKRSRRGIPFDYQKVLHSFRAVYGPLKKQGLEIIGVASLGDETVIQIRYPKSFDASLIPKTYKGLKIQVAKRPP